MTRRVSRHVAGAILAVALAASPAVARPVLTGDALLHARKGLDHLYHARLDSAAASFERLRAEDPESPAADFLLGGIEWHLVTTGPQGFTAGGPAEDRFFRRMDQAIAVGEARLDRDPSDAAARFFVGGAYGYKARYLALQEKWWDAYRTGKRGVSHLERVVEEAPDLEDAYLGLGIYHYYADVLPGVLKVLAPLVGMNGDRERGLAEIRRAVRGGVLVGVEGRFFLAEIYTTLEEDHWTAYGYSRGLREEFPEHDLFTWIHARVLDELHRSEEAAEQWERLAATARDRRTKGFLEYRLARTQLFGGDFEGAAARLDESLKYGRLASPRMTMWGRLRYGQALDVLGRHEEALQQYRLAHDLDASDSARERTGRRLDAGRRDASVVSLDELAEDAEILRDRAAPEETVAHVEHLLTSPSRGLSGSESDLYFETIALLAHARLRHGDADGAVATVDRAIGRRPRPDKRQRASLLSVRARAQLRRGDIEAAREDLRTARSLSAGDTRERFEREMQLVEAAGAVPAATPAEAIPAVPFRVPDRGELSLAVERADGQRFPLALGADGWTGTVPVDAEGMLVYRFREDDRRTRPDPAADRIVLRGDEAWCVRVPQPRQTNPSPSG